jgi:laminin beta 1
VTTLREQFPALNEKVCGAAGDECDDICGGPTCSVCGGPSCDAGAVTRAQQAAEFAQKAADMLHTKQQDAAKMLDEVSTSVVIRINISLSFIRLKLHS